MKRLLSGTIGLACTVLLLAANSTRAAEAKLPASGTTPADLVAAALRTELNGPTTEREALLKQALELDPDFAPARWQLGQVRWNDEWLPLADVPSHVGDNGPLAEYRKRRDALVDTAANHRALARWCNENALPDEARIHWAKVLEFEPANNEAQAVLGVAIHEGRLLSREQIAREQELAAARDRAIKEWRPELTKWRKAIVHGGKKGRLAALGKVRAITDDAMIAPLEAVFAENRASTIFDELNLLLIETVGRMAVPEATQVLLRRAVLPESKAVREAACDQLKKRPMFVYVPQLLAALPSSLSTQFQVHVLPGGMVLHEHEVLIEGRSADVSLSYTSAINPADAAARVTPLALRTELSRAAAIEAQAGAIREQAEWLRERVEFALARTTGFKNVDDPKLWEQQYNAYYDWYSTPPEKRYYPYSYANAEGYATTPVRVTHNVTAEFQDPANPLAVSCFPRGTQIATLDGPRPIEQITTGDRVLSQNIETGELVFRPVQERTLRTTNKLLNVTVGDSRSVVATMGHPFWVAGQGWRVTRDLEPGDLLHTLGGAIRVDKIEELPPTEVYNLVVSDFHNYFVGEDGLLVHDNSPLLETGLLVPGLSRQAESP